MQDPIHNIVHLANLGWNVAERFPHEIPARVILVERPFHFQAAGLRELHLSGETGDDAIHSFLDADVTVRVCSILNRCPTPSGSIVGVVCVEAVSPLPGEDGDQWFILRGNVDIEAFVRAEKTDEQFTITRREAQLMHCDGNGRRLVHLGLTSHRRPD